jgi:dihydroxyacetone kinase
MKKLINRPERLVDEMLDGLAACHPGQARLAGWPVIVEADRRPSDWRVALVSGGGSGHEPAHAGYVGRGMLSAAVAGAVFTSPSSDAVGAAIRSVGGPAGVLLILKNYTGDRLNFGIAAEQARLEGISVETVVVADDVALARSVEHAGRRGIAGTVFLHKVAGAAAEAGLGLAEVAAEARATAQAVRSMAVALSPCTIPGAEASSFALGPNEVELGLGIHGEPGVERIPLADCDSLIARLVEPIVADLALQSGDRCALLVNNLGGTPPMELALAGRRALGLLEGRGVVVERAYLGTFLTAIEMAGISISVLRVDDRRLARLDAPTSAPAWPAAFGHPRLAPGDRTRRLPPGRDDKTPPTPPGPPTSQSGIFLARALAAVLDAIRRNEARLDALDRAIGDGDLGQNLCRGAEGILQAWDLLPFDYPVELLQQVARLVQKHVGGTSGPLHAVFLLRLAQALPPGNLEDARAWVEAARAGIEGIGALGGARLGDRTVLDGLAPAIDALEQGLREGRAPADVWKDAAQAALEGAQATAALLPRRGRASYLGTRALGHPDPGAVEAALLIEALAALAEHPA